MLRGAGVRVGRGGGGGGGIAGDGGELDFLEGLFEGVFAGDDDGGVGGIDGVDLDVAGAKEEVPGEEHEQGDEDKADEKLVTAG